MVTTPAKILPNDDLYILNQCTKFLARTNTDPRHNFGQFSDEDRRSQIAETWRFPIIDSYCDNQNLDESYKFNRVTFVYQSSSDKPPQTVAAIGTFANLYAPIPLQPVLFIGEPSGYYALTILVPKGELHTYKYVVDGQTIIDPINPQRAMLDNGQFWSRFFTNLCTEPLCFEDWEFIILDRLVDHILPFRTEEGENFLNRYYKFLETQDKQMQYAYAYRLDQSVGVSNFIDNLLAREENHHLIDYKVCLEIINRILRQRNPFIEPRMMSKELYIQIYDEMGKDKVDGWDYQKYASPLFFLQLMRRHIYTGAFSHPKYGGNVGGAAWAYLSERFRDENGETLFNWRKAIEKPLGVNSDYRG
jgi:hypothetical protein